MTASASQLLQNLPHTTRMLVCSSLCNFAHETAGAARARLSLRPLHL